MGLGKTARGYITMYMKDLPLSHIETRFLNAWRHDYPQLQLLRGVFCRIMKMPNIADDQKRIVIVTHDESCFYSYDDQDCKSLRPKSGCRSIMVSEFLCECHGPMKLSDVQQSSRPNVPCETVQIIKPGKNVDGSWTNADLVQQLEMRAIPILKVS